MAIVVELDPQNELGKVIEYFATVPKQVSWDTAAEALQIDMGRVRWLSRSSQKWFTNVGGVAKRSGTKLVVRPLDHQIAVVVADRQDSMAVKTSGKSDPVIRDQRGTQIVWAPAPPIPDVSEKYSFFEKPYFYDRLKSKLLGHRRNVRLAGPPGIGKSVAVEYLAATEVLPLVNIGAESGLRARQLIGGMSDLGRFEVAEFATAVVQGWWAKIDEVNGADPDAILFLNSITAPPYTITINGRTYPVHPEFRLCVTYNPGLVGTKPLPDSLKDRLYPFKLKFPTQAQLTKMLKSNGVAVDSEAAMQMIAFSLKVAEERNQRHCRFDITIRRLLDAWTDIQDGYKVRDALYNSCIDGIDDMTDAAFVEKLLPN